MGVYKPGRPYKYLPDTMNSRRPPSKPGEYRIRDESGSISYIGETNDLDRRLKEHSRTGKLATGGSYEYKIADGRSTSNTRRVHEQDKIRQHNPSLNKSRGGEGRLAKK